MNNSLTCFKCYNNTAELTYEKGRTYKVSCPCGCEYSFEHSSMKCAEEYHYKMFELYREIDRVDRLKAELSDLQSHEKETVERAKLWGKDLIEFNSDAHVSICTECSFPIADYGVDVEIRCSWCKAKNKSNNYVPVGLGYCKTKLDRKAKTFDKLFYSGIK